MEGNLTDMLSRRIGRLSTLIRADIEEWNKTMEVSNEKQIPFEKLEYLELIKGYVSRLEAFERKRNHIEENSTRQTVKAYMVGKLSVGKSTIINAMLEHNVFRASVAQATSCFICIKPSNECSISYRRNQETITEMFADIRDMRDEIDRLANVSNDNHLRFDECLNICWPRSISGITADMNTEIFDVPGFGTENQIDAAVQQRCLDANILVMVVKTEPDKQERKFITTHCDQSSRPDILVLVNCSDNTDGDDEDRTEMNRNSIRFEWISALRDCARTPEAESEGRIFFVSAKEILLMRSQGVELTENGARRRSEFLRFEQCLTSCARKPAQIRLNTAATEYENISAEINTITDNFINEYNQIKKTQTVAICDGIIEKIDEHIAKLQKRKCDELSKMKTEISDTKQLHILKADKKIEIKGLAKKIAFFFVTKKYTNESSTEEDMEILLRTLDSDMNKMVSAFINIVINHAQRHSQTNSGKCQLEDPQKAPAGIVEKMAQKAETLLLGNIDENINDGNASEADAAIVGKAALFGAAIGINVGARVLIVPLSLTNGPVLAVGLFRPTRVAYEAFRRRSKEALEKEVANVAETVLLHYVNVLKDIKDLFEQKNKMIRTYESIDIADYLQSLNA